MAPSKLSLLRALLWCPVWLLFLHPWWSRSRNRRAPWVIGGHRGRLYADNAAAVEAEARSQGHELIWIGNAALLPELRTRGVRCLKRHSLAARRAISEAPVLIYSHGEDDLDTVLILLRGRTGLRVYLNHSLNLLKAGGVLDPQFLALPPWLRAVKRWLITDCDVFLAASQKERENFERSYPMHASKMHLGGGAHLDAWRDAASVAVKRQIYWFPTFRESSQAKQKLLLETQTLCASLKLKTWLLDHGYEFLVGTHINSATSPLQLEAPFSWAPLSRLGDDVRESEVLISDYSGMIFSFLMLKRPILLFPFDLENYLSSRALYVDYQDLDFAHQTKNSQRLIDLIVSEAWRAPELREKSEQKRAAWLPSADKHFARESVATINDLADKFWEK